MDHFADPSAIPGPEEGNFSAGNSNLTDSLVREQPQWALVSLAVIPMWILTGNLLVLLAVCGQRNLRTLSNWVIASLAFTDFLLAITVVPLGTYQVVSESLPFLPHTCVLISTVNTHFVLIVDVESRCVYMCLCSQPAIKALVMSL